MRMHYIHWFDVRLRLDSTDPRFDSALHNFLAEYSDEEIKERLLDGRDPSSLLKHAVHVETFDESGFSGWDDSDL